MAKLKLLDETQKDFSDEFLTLMAIIGYCIYAAELVINKAARTCDLEGLRGSFFQEKKRMVSNCADAFKRLVTNLEAFDSWFDTVQRGRADYCKYIHQNATDLVTLLLLYYSRTENHPEMRDRIFGVIRSFEIDDNADYESLFEYFGRKF